MSVEDTTKIGFTTPIMLAKNSSAKLKQLGKITENYFNFGGRIAVENMSGTASKIQLHFFYSEPNWKGKIINVAKALSFCTGIIPIVMGIGRAIFRSSNKDRFEILKLNQKEVIAGIQSKLNTMSAEEFKKLPIPEAGMAKTRFCMLQDQDNRLWIFQKLWPTKNGQDIYELEQAQEKEDPMEPSKEPNVPSAIIRLTLGEVGLINKAIEEKDPAMKLG